MANEKIGKIAAIEHSSEVLKVPEKPAEASRETPVQKSMAPVETPVAPAFHVPAAKPVAAKEPMLVKIEGILAEDLADVYENLPDELKPKFRAKGEETAGKIRQMMQDAKVKARQVLKLIKEWLKMIPGVNKFFLEQEATIKTQKLLGLKKDEPA